MSNAMEPALAASAQSEDELRSALALPGCPWKYLRFVQGQDGKWAPAAGTFEGWPKAAKDVMCLDPCMGSGHFVVAIFERMVGLRMAEEALDEAAAVAAVIRDNLFGLEIDPRCTQIAAFNLALKAWRRVGHCTLPTMNLACSGLAPNAKKEDWQKLAGDDDRLRNGMERLYRLFKDAPVLGSLINPRAAEGDLLVGAFHELQPLLERAFASEISGGEVYEMAVTARGMAEAAKILGNKFTLVATNVPYLASSKQHEILKAHVEDHYSEGKADLSTAFVLRCLASCGTRGSVAVVTPQNWLFLTTYTKLRQKLLRNQKWNVVARLGSNAFENMNWWAATTALVVISEERSERWMMSGIDVSSDKAQDVKASRLANQIPTRVDSVEQSDQLLNPDARISFGAADENALLQLYGEAYIGQRTGDGPRFIFCYWELSTISNGWVFFGTTVDQTCFHGGLHQALLWEDGKGQLAAYQARLAETAYASGGWKQGWQAWDKDGVRVSQMGDLPVTLHTGSHFDNNSAVIVPKDPKNLPAIWAFCESPQFRHSVRLIDQSLKVTNATLVKVPFDISHWQKVAEEKFPQGLPKPFSSDPTQWLFNGYPKGSDRPLQVAVSRLLGYQWPRQTGSGFPDCPALGPDGLETLGDADGIVCLSVTKGEPAAAERLRGLLGQAYSGEWSASVQQDLLSQVGYAGKTLDDWLRDGFFEQHCALFHHRPFIWHIWDGLGNGFSALVNYHQLSYANLEKLTYAYLGDWLRRQQAAVNAGEAGSDARLQAAKQLQSKLKLILEGEPPYDIFVRWKPLSNQAVGWHPDLNDGVRMNIRPFAMADILRKRVKIKWDKDRGKEPVREKNEFPWFWGWDEKTQDFTGVGKEPDGNRWNDCHYTNEFKRKTRSE